MSAALLAAFLGAVVPHPISAPNPFAGARFVAEAYACSPRRTCKQIATCDEAVWYLQNCTWGGKLDGDNDGHPCENLCGSGN